MYNVQMVFTDLCIIFISLCIMFLDLTWVSDIERHTLIKPCFVYAVLQYPECWWDKRISSVEELLIECCQRRSACWILRCVTENVNYSMTIFNSIYKEISNMIELIAKIWLWKRCSVYPHWTLLFCCCCSCFYKYVQ